MVPHTQASGSPEPIKNKVTALTLTPLSNIPLIRRDDNLADIFVISLLESNILIQDNDILVLAQKIVSKAEGRAVNLTTVTPSQRALELAKETEKDARVVEFILQESYITAGAPGEVFTGYNVGH